MILYYRLASFHFNLMNSLSIFAKAGLIVMKSFSFYSSEKVFLSPLFLMEIIFDIIFLVGNIFLSACWMYYYSILAYNVSVKKSENTLIAFPCMKQVTFLLSLSNFSLCLWFDNLIVMCHSVNFFGFILFVVFWVFWIWMSISLPRSGKFLVIIYLNKLFAPFSFCSFPNSIHVYWSTQWCPINPLNFLHYFSFYFLFVFLTYNFQWSVFEFADPFFCLILSSNEWWNPSLIF